MGVDATHNCTLWPCPACGYSCLSVPTSTSECAPGHCSDHSQKQTHWCMGSSADTAQWGCLQEPLGCCQDEGGCIHMTDTTQPHGHSPKFHHCAHIGHVKRSQLPAGRSGRPLLPPLQRLIVTDCPPSTSAAVVHLQAANHNQPNVNAIS